jgi:uncharacterized protein YabN with tetrapyrrole methylase and pyrophosphatase domain
MNTDSRDRSSLVIVGCGIKFISHLTTEAKAYIEQSDKVLYLINEPAMKEWIQNANPNTESLDGLYTKHPLRKDCYREITNFILENLRKKQHVCVVMYGHPTVFAQPALDAVNQARKEGYDARVLPGISAEDCLFADLLINPGSHGCQSFEATDLLLYRKKIDPTCHLILWQVSVIGELGHSRRYDNKQGINLLITYLLAFYKPEQEVVLYEAAQYPHFEPVIERLSLSRLSSATISRIATLYIPPAYKAACDESVMKILGIKITEK